MTEIKHFQGDESQTLISPEQLADRWTLPLATIYQLNHKGTGPRRIKIGKHVRYRLADVIAWENAQVVDNKAHRPEETA